MASRLKRVTGVGAIGTPRRRSLDGGVEVEALPAPADLEAELLALGNDQYALFSFPLPVPAAPEGLSATEREITNELAFGAAPADIAKKRGRSLATIRNQIRSIYAKLEVSSLLGLVSRCVRAE